VRAIGGFGKEKCTIKQQNVRKYVRFMTFFWKRANGGRNLPKLTRNKADREKGIFPSWRHESLQSVVKLETSNRGKATLRSVTPPYVLIINL
jgi:hypothetical protein